MKNIMLLVFFVIFSCISGLAQQSFRIDNKGIGWGAGEDGYRCINLPKSTVIFKLTHIASAKYRDVWNNQPVKVESTDDGFDFLSFEMAPRGLACIVAEK
jgi:hypothetical protein